MGGKQAVTKSQQGEQAYNVAAATSCKQAATNSLQDEQAYSVTAVTIGKLAATKSEECRRVPAPRPFPSA
ncbi:MAG: hypothetical protein ACFNM7_02190 [Prevotella conceptionensis]|jgi:lipoprotein